MSLLTVPSHLDERLVGRAGRRPGHRPRRAPAVVLSVVPDGDRHVHVDTDVCSPAAPAHRALVEGLLAAARR